VRKEYVNLPSHVPYKRMGSRPSLWGWAFSLKRRILTVVQRLFSMFPTGIAGVGLLLLRVLVAATLLVDGTLHWAIVKSLWTIAVFVLPGMCLCLGLFTPYAAIFSSVIQLGVLIATGGQSGFDLTISILSSVAVATLGPGAYSIDARLFGRRVLDLTPRR
jgi:uncharacterized membrane protein YphA (DoxX/SURF4 family)